MKIRGTRKTVTWVRILMMSRSREISVRAEVYDNVDVVSTLYCILHRKVDVIPLRCSFDETGPEKRGGSHV